MIYQLRKEVSQVTNTFYELLIEMAAEINKPMSEITLNEVSQVMRKKRTTNNLKMARDAQQQQQ
jgi:UDP-N-acetyl-D-mannosaminuronate dehydrogenase